MALPFRATSASPRTLRFLEFGGKVGLAYPPQALGDLLEAVSASEAKRMLFTGERVSAEKALRIGLINEIVEEGGLDNHIARLAETLCANAPLSLKAAKEAVSHLGSAQDPQIWICCCRAHEPA